METHDFDKLDRILAARDRASQHDRMGALYAWWGLYNTLGVWIFQLVWTDTVFWMFWIPAGIAVQTLLVALLRGEDRRVIWDRTFVARVWASALLVLPLLVWLFPMVLHVYAYTMIFPIVVVWVGVTMYVAGIFSRQPVLTVAALLWITMAPLFLFFPDASPIIFTVLNLVGLMLPGLWSLYDERR